MRTTCPACRRPIRTLAIVNGDTITAVTAEPYPTIGVWWRTSVVTDTATVLDTPAPGGWKPHTCAAIGHNEPALPPASERAEGSRESVRQTR